ncbi:MAG TPA: tripartite tricarboxylate transporter TctB family protein [Candidatus Limnocylindrales bacterium]|nr:tripartite tricarboxylate transporter TctB family protein [Candidatus Limnocylindrales bacterium]
MRGAPKDILSGLIFIAFGLAFAAGATSYQIGTPVQMGPGYFPLVTGGLLGVLGAIVVVQGFLAKEAEPVGGIPRRALLLIVGAILVFGVTVKGLGLLPALFVAVFMSAFASERARINVAAVIATGLTALCYLVFVVLLNLRLPLFGPWLRF